MRETSSPSGWQIGEVNAASAMKEAALTNIRDPDYRIKKLDDLVAQAKSHVERVAA